MANENLGASFSIDVTQLKAGLAQANRLIRESESEFRAAAAGMDNWQDSEEGVSKKIKSLNEITEIQKQKVNALQSEYDRLIAEGLDPTSRQAVELRTKINKETEALNKNEAELGRQNEALENLQNGLDDAGDSADDMGDSVKNAGDGFTVLNGAISNLIAQGISSFIDGCKELISSIINLDEETREYREDMGKLETAFEAAGKSTELATSVYKDFYSVLGEEDRSVEAVNHLAKFVETEEDMATWTNICAGVWGTFGDSLPIEGLTEAANETARTGELTGVLTDALNWAADENDDFGISLQKNTDFVELSNEELAKLTDAQKAEYEARKEQQKEIDAYNQKVQEAVSAEDKFKIALENCTTEQERAQLITDTLNSLYYEASEAYKENNASVIDARNATSELTDAQAELGEQIEPVKTEVTNLKTEFLKGLAPAIGNDVIPVFRDFISQIGDSGVIDKFTSGVSSLSKSVLPVLGDALLFVVDNIELFVKIGKAALTGFLAAKTVNVISNMADKFKALGKALELARDGQLKLNAAQAANVVGAVVTGIVLLVEGLKSFVEVTEDAINGFDKINEQTQKNIEANAEWQKTMNTVKATLGDYSSMTNAAGESSEDLKQQMADAQAGITEIFATAYQENRELRDDEIESVKAFNEQYIAAQQELRDLQGAILKAQTDSLQWQLENLDLSEEETQGILNSLEETRNNYLAYMDNSIAEEIALLDSRYQRGEITESEYNRLRTNALSSQKKYRDESKRIQEDAYKDGLAQLGKDIELHSSDFTEKEKHFSSIQEIHQHYTDKIKELEADESKSGWEKFWAKQGLYEAEIQATNAFADGQEVTWTDYNFMTDEKIGENVQAFFNWLGETQKYGGEISGENIQLATDILNAYSDLPADLQNSGIETLKGLLSGLNDSGKHSELINSSTATASQLISAINSELGVRSPSWKMRESGKNLLRGLRDGTNDHFTVSSLLSTARSVASSVLSTIKSTLKINSPSKVTLKYGMGISEGLALGISESTKDVVKTAKEQVAQIQGVYSNSDLGGNYNATVKSNAPEGLASGKNNVVVYQTNNYSQAHSRYELYKSKQDTANAVRLALKGV